MNPILECKGLTRKFNHFFALSNVDLTLERGEIIGLLGPNGSGKTTLIKLINGLLLPTDGQITVNGSVPGVETKKIVSYLPERGCLDERRRISELISYYSDFYSDFDVSRAHTMLKDLDIDPSLRLKTLSKGTKEKVQLILVMSRNAQLYAGVSIATVSRVLNGNPNVSEKTREKVLKVMDELGYTPNVFARGLGLNTMRTIGIMCSDSSDPYLAGAIYYLERGLRSHGYDAILCCTGYDLDAKQKYFDLLRSKRVDAIILAGSKFVEMRAKDNAYIIEAASDLPIMLVNGFLEGDDGYIPLLQIYLPLIC